MHHGIKEKRPTVCFTYGIIFISATLIQPNTPKIFQKSSIVLMYPGESVSVGERDSTECYFSVLRRILSSEN